MTRPISIAHPLAVGPGGYGHWSPGARLRDQTAPAHLTAFRPFVFHSPCLAGSQLFGGSPTLRQLGRAVGPCAPGRWGGTPAGGQGQIPSFPRAGGYVSRITSTPDEMTCSPARAPPPENDRADSCWLSGHQQHPKWRHESSRPATGPEASACPRPVSGRASVSLTPPAHSPAEGKS